MLVKDFYLFGLVFRSSSRSENGGYVRTMSRPGSPLVTSCKQTLGLGKPGRTI